MTHYHSLVDLIKKLKWENMPFQMAIVLVGKMYHNFATIVMERHGDSTSFEEFAIIVYHVPTWTSDNIFGLLYTDTDFKINSVAHKMFIEKREDIEKVLMAGIKIQDIVKSFDQMYPPKKQTCVSCYDEEIINLK